MALWTCDDLSITAHIWLKANTQLCALMENGYNIDQRIVAHVMLLKICR